MQKRMWTQVLRRRKLLALGGLSAVYGLARGAGRADAAHTSLNEPEPLHVGP